MWFYIGYNVAIGSELGVDGDQLRYLIFSQFSIYCCQNALPPGLCHGPRWGGGGQPPVETRCRGPHRIAGPRAPRPHDPPLTTRIWDVCVLLWTQNVLTFGSYYSMETYDETLASLTQKRDWLSRADNLGTQVNSHNGLKATYDMVMIITQAGKQSQDPITMCLQYPRLSAWNDNRQRLNRWYLQKKRLRAFTVRRPYRCRNRSFLHFHTFTLSFLSITAGIS